MPLLTPVQNVQFAAGSVTANPEPPEGRKVIPFVVVLTPSDLTYNSTINLQNLIVSQICTAIVDNTQGICDISCQFGVANHMITVPAGGGLIFPVFSNGPIFSVAITGILDASGLPLAANSQINVTLLNYVKAPGSWGNNH